MIKNPVTGKWEHIDKLPSSGYKRRYLELLKEYREFKSHILNAVKLDGTLNFSKEKWTMEESDDAYHMHLVATKSDEPMKLFLVDFEPYPFEEELG